MNPLGQSIVVNNLIMNCQLVFGDHIFLANLLLLSFHEFHVILGLDWQTRNNVMVHCQTRSVHLVYANDKELLMFGKQS